MTVELLVADRQLTLQEGDETYFTRTLDNDALDALSGFAAGYAALVPKENNRDGLVALGRELFAWLDGHGRGLTRAQDNAPPPFVLEITCLSRNPSPPEQAVLDAPWEILADAGGFLAEDAILGFTPVRRLQTPNTPDRPDEHRLGLVFMAASPRQAAMLDYEAEEAAVIKAVGEHRIDLVVEETGELDELGRKLGGLRHKLDELGHKLGDLQSMTALHLSCHGGVDGGPCLLLEDNFGTPSRPAPPN